MNRQHDIIPVHCKGLWHGQPVFRHHARRDHLAGVVELRPGHHPSLVPVRNAGGPKP